jgi:AraC family transcriptional regulator
MTPHVAEGAGTPRHLLHEDIEVVLFESPVLRIGRWRCPVDHPAFRCSGPTAEAFFVFPREPVWIQHEHEPAFVADANTVTYYNAGQHYERRRLSERGDRCEWFALAPEIIAETLGEHEPHVTSRHDAPFCFTHGPADHGSYLRQRFVFDHVSREETPDCLLVEESIVQVLAKVSVLAAGHPRRTMSIGPRRSKASIDAAEELRSILATRYTERPSLADLARMVGSSVFHLSRTFHERTGFTIHEYRTELRLRAALDRIADPSADLLEIALALGFSSHSHFTETFRRRFGQTPSAYRRH